MTTGALIQSDPTQELRHRVDEASAFLKRFANPDRLLVTCALVEGERSVRALEEMLGLRQPGLSQQLAQLRSAGLIVGRKAGKQVYYRLADPRVETFIHTMHRLFCASEGSPEPLHASETRSAT